MTRMRTGLGVACIALALDQASKWWLLEKMAIATQGPITLAPFFDLVMVWNRGVSFGLFSENDSRAQAMALVALALVMCGWLLAWLWRDARLRRAEVWGIGLVVGGALGNAIDRLRFGAVADFFYAHVGTLGWPAFNVADSAICIGVALLLLVSMLAPSE